MTNPNCSKTYKPGQSVCSAQRIQPCQNWTVSKKKRITNNTVWNVALYAADIRILTKTCKINCQKHLKCGHCGGCWQSVGWRRCQTKRCWYVPMKLGAYRKRFGTGSIDGLDMFLGTRTFYRTLLKGKWWARLLGIGKGWSYCMIWKKQIIGSWKIYSQADQGRDRTASEKPCKKSAGNSRRLKKKKLTSHVTLSATIALLVPHPFLKPSSSGQRKSSAFPWRCHVKIFSKIFEAWAIKVAWPWPRSFQGQFVTDTLGHAMINLLTKFEVSNFTHYGNMTSSSAMAERPCELGDFKKARVNGGTNNHSVKDSHKCLRCLWHPHHMVIK